MSPSAPVSMYTQTPGGTRLAVLFDSDSTHSHRIPEDVKWLNGSEFIAKLRETVAKPDCETAWINVDCGIDGNNSTYSGESPTNQDDHSPHTVIAIIFKNIANLSSCRHLTVYYFDGRLEKTNQNDIKAVCNGINSLTDSRFEDNLQPQVIDLKFRVAHAQTLPVEANIQRIINHLIERTANDTLVFQHHSPTSTEINIDFTVVLLGTTGSGKSSFIEALSEKDQKLSISGGGLESVTQHIHAFKLCNAVSRARKPRAGEDGDWDVYVVDTPGFSDRKMSEVQIIRKLYQFQRDTFCEMHHAFYFHRITDKRVPGSARRIIQMIKAFRLRPFDLTIVTTMWDNVHGEEAMMRAESNFVELRDVIWKLLANPNEELEPILISNLKEAEEDLANHFDQLIDYQLDGPPPEFEQIFQSVIFKHLLDLTSVSQRFARAIKNTLSQFTPAENNTEHRIDLEEMLKMARRDFQLAYATACNFVPLLPGKGHSHTDHTISPTKKFTVTFNVDEAAVYETGDEGQAFEYSLGVSGDANTHGDGMASAEQHGASDMEHVSESPLAVSIDSDVKPYGAATTKQVPTSTRNLITNISTASASTRHILIGQAACHGAKTQGVAPERKPKRGRFKKIKSGFRKIIQRFFENAKRRNK
ncbi:hypothetical protein CVT24_010292 [Panaeolus cyanescens]|uniref:G domain-containing protein n=1 Tax=Panaeolus cyanescens TaxID=181874 RepID=A0A409W934_9AGAR|nr:hypothetical protein CVT24_010292 [Panaeolus cyanescens]